MTNHKKFKYSAIACALGLTTLWTTPALADFQTLELENIAGHGTAEPSMSTAPPGHGTAEPSMSTARPRHC